MCLCVNAYTYIQVYKYTRFLLATSETCKPQDIKTSGFPKFVHERLSHVFDMNENCLAYICTESQSQSLTLSLS